MNFDLILNELSLQNLASNEQTAQQLMSEFIKTIKAIKAQGVKVNLRTKDNLYTIIIAPNYPIREESLNEVRESQHKFKQNWEEGKVDSWTRNYYLEHGLEPTVLSMNINFLPVGMSMSTCEPMGFKVGSPVADCILHDDGLEVRFVDFLREQLLFGGLLYGHCAKNNQYDYLYIGKLPNHSEVAGEVIKKLLPF